MEVTINNSFIISLASKLYRILTSLLMYSVFYSEDYFELVEKWDFSVAETSNQKAKRMVLYSIPWFVQMLYVNKESSILVKSTLKFPTTENTNSSCPISSQRKLV